MKKHYYKVTLETYFDHICFTEEEAKQEFVDFIKNNDTDIYGRTWEDLIEVIKLGDVKDE